MPVAPMAIGTPMPSTLAWTAIRSSTGSNWKIALIDPRVTPSVNDDVDDPGGDDEREQQQRRRARTEGGDEHRDRQDGHHGRVGHEAEAKSEAGQQPRGEQEEEGDVDRVEETRVEGDEPGQLGCVGVAGGRPVEHEEVEDLAPHGRQQLVGEHEHDEPRRQQRAHRRAWGGRRPAGRRASARQVCAGP